MTCKQFICGPNKMCLPAKGYSHALLSKTGSLHSLAAAATLVPPMRDSTFLRKNFFQMLRLSFLPTVRGGGGEGQKGQRVINVATQLVK
jgi:hypothetical protein